MIHLRIVEILKLTLLRGIVQLIFIVTILSVYKIFFWGGRGYCIDFYCYHFIGLLVFWGLMYLNYSLCSTENTGIIMITLLKIY